MVINYIYTNMRLFKNRQDAGEQLSKLLAAYKDQDVIVYALPRGGVTVAKEIAKFLKAPLDLIFAHKIGHPYQLEYAIGAISERGYLIGEELKLYDSKWLEATKAKEIQEMKRKRALYLKGKKSLDVEGKVAIIVDDGIATGRTMEVGIMELRGRNPEKIVMAVPVAPRSTFDKLATLTDDAVGVEIPEDEEFVGAVGAYYNEFDQVEDEEVIALLNRSER